MAKLSLFERRRRRVRTALRARAGGKPRLSVHRTGRHIYAQIIDDLSGVTLCAATSLKKSGRDVTGSKLEQARQVGKKIAELAKAKGIESVSFDRGGFLYHGRVKSLAEGAREGGLNF